MDARWYLVWDRHRFHVYVAVETDLETVRIDWHQNSTLEFAPFTKKEGEEKVMVGRAPYCYQCLVDELYKRLYRYHLFSFNCRTVSFLIMTEVLGFDEQQVYDLFKARHTQCGLDSLQCFSPSEIDHFIAWRNAGNTIGNYVVY
jgi:hypothetical protein